MVGKGQSASVTVIAYCPLHTAGGSYHRCSFFKRFEGWSVSTSGYRKFSFGQGKWSPSFVLASDPCCMQATVLNQVSLRKRPKKYDQKQLYELKRVLIKNIHSLQSEKHELQDELMRYNNIAMKGHKSKYTKIQPVNFDITPKADPLNAFSLRSNTNPKA